MMHMTFYWGREAIILFSSWKTDSWTSYGLSLVALFLAGSFYQYMEDRRIRFKALIRSTPPSPIEVPFLFSRAVTPRGWNPARFAVAVLFGVNAAIGYLLMLALMSFNGGVFIAVVLGLTAGYLFFRSDGEDHLLVLEPSCAGASCACA